MDNFNQNLKVVSLNCNGLKNKIPVIGSLISGHDVILLQETWLLPNELSLVQAIHKDYDGLAISAVDLSQGVLWCHRFASPIILIAIEIKED